MARSLGIDLGTANTLCYMKGKGILLREPSVVALDNRSDKILAVGKEAKMMLGKTPGSIVAVRPLKEGVIAEFDITAKMLAHFFKKVAKTTFWNRPNVIICIPYGVTEVEKRAVEDVTLEAGARNVALIEEPIAAAIGSGLNIGDPRGCMIVDIGGGTTEVAVISLGGIVNSTSLRQAGDEIDSAILSYMKHRYNVLIGESTAELLKKSIGIAHRSIDRGSKEVQGRHLITGRPATIEVHSSDMLDAMREPLIRIVETIKSTIEKTPPELVSDIYDNGIMLAGGGAFLAGLDQLIHDATGVKVQIAPRPLDSVVLGIGHVLEKADDLLGVITFRGK